MLTPERLNPDEGSIGTGQRDLEEERRLLESGCDAAEVEHDRIAKLIKHPPLGSLLHKRAKDVQTVFNRPMNKVDILIDEIKYCLGAIRDIEEGRDLAGEPGEGIEADEDKTQRIAEKLDEGWAKLGEVRRRLLPVLANDLLATIGGLYLYEMQLDDAGERLGDPEGGKVSFSDLAGQLVAADGQRAGAAPFPVLIVGEERFDVSGAVIRLRFPDCDIWNLPLTAHEYGYLITMGSSLQGVPFEDFRNRVRDQVDPDKHGEKPVTPGNEDCFLDIVRQYWVRHRELTDDTERARHRQQLAVLRDLQDHFLCRLFADAFATLFGGPAYIYALIHLRLCPNELVSPEMPPFSHRVAFSLGILKKMDLQPMVRGKRGTFGDVTKNITHIWDTLQAGLGMESLTALEKRYEGWLEEMYRCFAGLRSKIEATYEYWEGSSKPPLVYALTRNQGLAKKVWNDDPPEPLVERPPMWTVLNAVWALRCNHFKDIDPDLKEIGRNALSLLDEKDNSLIEEGKRESGSERSPAGEREAAQQRRRGPEYIRPVTGEQEVKQWIEQAPARIAGLYAKSLQSRKAEADVVSYLRGAGGTKPVEAYYKSLEPRAEEEAGDNDS
jgi:hypothetical protein